MENQITLNEWLEWKEDIRRKLTETAENFVYIGYRLRQIRDSGMMDGCEDIYAFAKKEYGLGKSTVSRFMAINERFSEGGNALELRSEYKAIGYSKLAEMLTLSDAECQLITEQTTVKEIRELKNFDRQRTPEEEIAEPLYSPLQRCIIDYFSEERRKDALNETMKLLAEDPSEQNQQRAAELINPGEYATHKKGIIFLFLYDYKTGVKYKKMGDMEPVSLTWTEFLSQIIGIYSYCVGPEFDVWECFYGATKKEDEKAEETQQNQGFEGSVATSQQDEKTEEIEDENSAENEQESEEETEDGEASSGDEGEEADDMPEEEDSAGSEQGADGSGRDGEAEEETQPGSDGNAEIVTMPIAALKKEGESVTHKIRNFFYYNTSDDMELDELVDIKTVADELVAILEQMIELKKEEE